MADKLLRQLTMQVLQADELEGERTRAEDEQTLSLGHSDFLKLFDKIFVLTKEKNETETKLTRECDRGKTRKRNDQG